jgi:hypothetical protein
MNIQHSRKRVVVLSKITVHRISSGSSFDEGDTKLGGTVNQDPLKIRPRQWRRGGTAWHRLLLPGGLMKTAHQGFETRSLVKGPGGVADAKAGPAIMSLLGTARRREPIERSLSG